MRRIVCGYALILLGLAVPVQANLPVTPDSYASGEGSTIIPRTDLAIGGVVLLAAGLMRRFGRRKV